MEHVLEFLHEYGVLFTVVSCVVAILGVVFTIYKASHDRQINKLEEDLKAAREAGDPVFLKDQNAQLRLENGQLQNDLGVSAADRNILMGRCDELQTEVTSLTSILEAERDTSRQKIDALSGELEKQKEALATKDRVEHRREYLVRNALKLEGKIWQRKVLRGVPPFRPLHDRHAAIISVVNLKGGVGKTTVTAHLAMGLSSRGYRVLMVDLDLQGSLSSLFVPETILGSERKTANCSSTS